MHFKISSAICFNLDQSRILSFGKELKKDPKEGNLRVLLEKKKKKKNTGSH